MSQICRFYQSGDCRFGQNCRFAHPREASSPSSTFGNTHRPGFGTANVVSGSGQLKLSESFNLPSQESIKTDLTERPTWFLSSYAPGKDPPSQLIDGKDISPEEARVLAYKCTVEGNPGLYEAVWQRLTSEAEAQIKNILNDLPGAVDFMKNAIENKANSRYNSNNAQSPKFISTDAKPSPFANTDQTVSTFGQPPQPNSAFGQSLQPTPAFSQSTQPTSPFGQSPQPNPTFGHQSQSTSAFGSASPFTAQSLPAFGQSGFSQTPATLAFGQSAFSSAITSTPQPQSPFRQPAFGQPAFGQPAFGQPAALGQGVSPFGALAHAAQQSTSASSQTPAFGTSSTAERTFGQPAFGQSPFQGSVLGVTAPVTQGQSQPSPFSQQQNHPVNSPFNKQVPNPNVSATPNVFQQVTAQNTASPFPNSNSFQLDHKTTAQQTQPTSAFDQPSQLAPAFGQPTTPVSAFGTPQQNFSNRSSFQSAQQVQQTSHQVNPVLREAQKVKKWDDPIIEYTKAEIDAFAAPVFTLGGVPAVAPSRHMCWA